MARIANWDYDRLIEYFDKLSHKTTRQLRDSNREKRKYIGLMKEYLRDAPRDWRKKYSKKTRNWVDILIKDCQKHQTPKVNKYRDELSTAHPFLIGPATLDSLLNKPPERYDYIADGKFPFDNVYFECMEPVKKTKLKDILEGDLIGIQLNKNIEDFDIITLPSKEIAQRYRMRAFFDSKAKGYSVVDLSGIISGLNTVCNAEIIIPKTKERIILLTQWFDDDGKIQIDPDPASNIEIESIPFEGHVIQKKELELFLKGTSKREDSPGPKEFEKRKELFEGLGQINELGINLINYINAHNVNIRTGYRQVRKRDFSTRGSRTPEYESDRPFHIVAIEESDTDNTSRNESYTLEWRVYVRGHNRHYRDDSGAITNVTWVTPHVRGPEDAPWKHHRYAALADMLKREKEKLSQYLPN